MTVKKAVDLIYDINDKIDVLLSKINSIEGSLSSINNKVYVLSEKVVSLEDKIENIKKPASAPPSAVTTPQPSADSTPRNSAKKTEKFLIGNVKIYGYVYNKSKSPISGVDVTLLTSNSEVVREMKTDSSGYWEARIRSGRYSVELKHGRFRPVNKFVEIPEGVSEYEVK